MRLISNINFDVSIVLGFVPFLSRGPRATGIFEKQVRMAAALSPSDHYDNYIVYSTCRIRFLRTATRVVLICYCECIFETLCHQSNLAFLQKWYFNIGSRPLRPPPLPVVAPTCTPPPTPPALQCRWGLGAGRASKKSTSILTQTRKSHFRFFWTDLAFRANLCDYSIKRWSSSCQICGTAMRSNWGYRNLTEARLGTSCSIAYTVDGTLKGVRDM